MSDEELRLACLNLAVATQSKFDAANTSDIIAASKDIYDWVKGRDLGAKLAVVK